MPKDLVPVHVAAAESALAKARDILADGGTALDAVQAAVEALENDPCFNAGTGACLNEDGELELDASIMSGADLRAGAVCALPPFKNPIAIARRALEDGRHVLYAGEGSVRFTLAQGFSPGDAAAMITERARERFQTVRDKGEIRGWAGGTVGAVARDERGHVAAATSTGGRINKAKGRVGDSPLIGAGTYADDEAGARLHHGRRRDHDPALHRTRSRRRAARRRDRRGSRREVSEAKRRLSGEGGVIIAHKDGSLGWARTTQTMTWAAASERWSGIKAGA